MSWPWRWIRGSLVVEGLNSLAGFLGFGNPLGLVISLAAGVAVGWWTAATTYAEAALAPGRAVGYVVIILVIALLFIWIIGAAATSAAKWRVLRERPPSGSAIAASAQDLEIFTRFEIFIRGHFIPVYEQLARLLLEMCDSGNSQDDKKVIFNDLVYMLAYLPGIADKDKAIDILKTQRERRTVDIELVEDHFLRLYEDYFRMKHV